MGRKITLEDIFAFRGQIMLTEKMKGKESCRCGLCEPPKRNYKNNIWYDAQIVSDHYDTIKIFVPMSKRKFKELQKTYKTSFEKKESYEQLLKQRKQNDKQQKRYFNNPGFRLYPLHKSVYDEFANYIYKKFGEPQFGKKKENIEGVQWGKCSKIMRMTRKYGTYVHKRTIGVNVHKGKFEFHVDTTCYVFNKKKTSKLRNKKIKEFRKKPGKLV